MKTAAGQFKFVQENLIGKLIKTESNKQQAFEDTKDIILSTYINQCKAEAQESNYEKKKLNIWSTSFKILIKKIYKIK